VSDADFVDYVTCLNAYVLFIRIDIIKYYEEPYIAANVIYSILTIYYTD
jgi:hypothetical protein